MASKVVWYRNAWWIRTRWDGNKKIDRKVGPTQADRREAEKIAKQVNAKLLLGTFEGSKSSEPKLRCGEALWEWLRTYSPTMKPSYENLCAGHIRNHLEPFFGTRDLRDIKEADLLKFIRVKLDAGLRPGTIKNSLSVLRRVYSLHVKEADLLRNPASGIGALIKRVDRRHAQESSEVEFWEQGEVETILQIANEHEPQFATLFHFLVATGARRGEALGLQWGDIDFATNSVSIRRAITGSGLTTPKSGRSRRLRMAPGLSESLFDLLSARRLQCIHRGWPELPAWVFCSEVGTAPDPANISRVWNRLRRRAEARGVRRLKLHCARHTWATRALGAGKSIKWVADQLGHADPALTLRVYAHAMKEEERDLSFAEFGGSKRLYPAPGEAGHAPKSAKSLNLMARREGFEPPTLRFEA